MEAHFDLAALDLAFAFFFSPETSLDLYVSSGQLVFPLLLLSCFNYETSLLIMSTGDVGLTTIRLKFSLSSRPEFAASTTAGCSIGGLTLFSLRILWYCWAIDMKLMMKTDKFKMTSQSEPLINLVNYYRDWVESNEHERWHWYSTINSLWIPQEYVHKLDWEIKKRIDETSELTRVL